MWNLRGLRCCRNLREMPVQPGRHFCLGIRSVAPQRPAQAFSDSKTCSDAQPESFRVLHRFQEYQDLAQLRFNFAGDLLWIPSSRIHDEFGVWSSGVFVWGIDAASSIALLSLIGVKPGRRTPCG